jgi:hypothetical protein
LFAKYFVAATIPFFCPNDDFEVSFVHDSDNSEVTQADQHLTLDPGVGVSDAIINLDKSNADDTFCWVDIVLVGKSHQPMVAMLLEQLVKPMMNRTHWNAKDSTNNANRTISKMDYSSVPTVFQQPVVLQLMHLGITFFVEV